MRRTMKAARLHGSKDIRVEDVPVPAISDNEILVKVKTAFLCGTDLRMYTTGHPAASPQTPLILGHEGAGKIEALGLNVAKYQKGMRVAVAPNIGCGLCDFCVAGMTHHCMDLSALGIHINGFLAQYVKIPEMAVRQGNVVEIADDLSYDEAALAEPFSCVLNAFEKCRISLGDHVLIIGAGPIGIMHALLAKMGGAVKVFINDLAEERLALCKSFDPEFITVPSDRLKATIMDETRGQGLDVCITACPAPQAQQIALELMAVNGRVSFFGGLPKDCEVVGLNSNLVHYKQIEISGTTRQSPTQYRKMLNLIASGALDVSKLVTYRTTLDQFDQALAAALSANGLKTAITFA